nr:pentatricopeptide repeat-containing protein At3g54980, mitochondrial-like [Ipomoea batatas]
METRVVEIVLGQRGDPDSAFEQFKLAMERCAFQRWTGEPFHVLLHILVSSSEHHHVARSLILKHVLGDSGPPSALFDGLVDSAKRFSFELNPVVFNSLLDSLVKARRVRDAIDCFNAMMDHGILIWPFLIGKVSPLSGSHLRLSLIVQLQVLRQRATSMKQDYTDMQSTVRPHIHKCAWNALTLIPD